MYYKDHYQASLKGERQILEPLCAKHDRDKGVMLGMRGVDYVVTTQRGTTSAVTTTSDSYHSSSNVKSPKSSEPPKCFFLKELNCIWLRKIHSPCRKMFSRKTQVLQMSPHTKVQQVGARMGSERNGVGLSGRFLPGARDFWPQCLQADRGRSKDSVAPHNLRDCKGQVK